MTGEGFSRWAESPTPCHQLPLVSVSLNDNNNNNNNKNVTTRDSDGNCG